MYKTTLLSLCLFWLVPQFSYGQVFGEIEVGQTCSFFGEDIPEKVTTFSSDQEAEDVIERIVSASGLVKNFLVRSAGVPNAAAVIRGETRYILYSQHFMQSIRRETGNSWAPISIMAHEVGHHLNGHTLDNRGSRPKIELEADYYSGFILQRMGATLDDARAAILKLGSASGSRTHPASHDRLAAIGNGWTKACESDARCSDSGVDTPRPAPELEPKPRPEPDSCEYANDGECDEPDLCSRGTDTSDCRVVIRPIPPLPPPIRSGFPSGHGMSVCGCWGFNPPPAAPEPRCQSGYVRLKMCPGFCQGGGNPYAYACQ